MTLGFDFIGSGLGICGALAVSPTIDFTGRPVSLFSTLSKAYLVYLHCVVGSFFIDFLLDDTFVIQKELTFKRN